MRNYIIATSGPNKAETSNAEVGSVTPDRVISGVDLLLHEEQMRLEGYPMPLLNSSKNQESACCLFQNIFLITFDHLFVIENM